MSDFHDADYYKRQRIIVRRVIKWVQHALLFYAGFMLFASIMQHFNWMPVKLRPGTMPLSFVVAFFMTAIFDFFSLNRELEEFDANVLKKRASNNGKENNTVLTSDAIESAPSKSISDFPELLQAIADKIISEDGRLLVKRSDFVIYCDQHNFFPPRNMECGWKPIEFLLRDRNKGNLLEAKKFSQSYQDLIRTGKVSI